MERFDYLIVGGGIAGVTAAETIRSIDAMGSIGIVAEEPHPLYSRVLLPHYVKGLIPRERIFLRKPDDYRARRISLLSGERVTRFDRAERGLMLESGRAVRFGKLLIATGGKPRRLDIGGEEARGVSRFQTVEDADHMLQLLGGVSGATVCGSGFIALEYLDILTRRRIPTTLLMRESWPFFGQLDAVGGNLLLRHFEESGITVVSGESLGAISQASGSIEGVRTASGKTWQCDFLGVGIGLDRELPWLDGMLSSRFGIETNERLETSTPGVFAAGDVAIFFDQLLGFRRSAGNWSNAFAQGKTAGNNMARPESPEAFRHVSAYTTRNLGWTIAFLGETRAPREAETVIRCDEQQKRYARFVLLNGIVIGAALMNAPDEQRAVSLLIRDRVMVPAEYLADPGRDLETALAEFGGRA